MYVFKQVRIEVEKIILVKLERAIEKTVLVQVSKIKSGITLENFDFELGLVPKLKFCPVTLVDVERSFSLYNHVLNGKRSNLLLQNLEMHIIN